MGGSIDITFDFPIIVKPLIEAGKVRALGISGEQRLPNMPDIKTLAEQGYPGAVLAPGAAIRLPARTPQPIVDKLADAFARTLEEPTNVKYFADQGAGVLQGIGKEKLVQFFDAERTKMKEIIDRTGIQPE